jgi:hypothetical protein
MRAIAAAPSIDHGSLMRSAVGRDQTLIDVAIDDTRIPSPAIPLHQRGRVAVGLPGGFGDRIRGSERGCERPRPRAYREDEAAKRSGARSNRTDACLIQTSVAGLRSASQLALRRHTIGVHTMAKRKKSTAKPYEVGAFGETGAPGFTGSASFRCGYATATESNPGYLSPHVAANPIQPAGFTVSSWRIGSARQMVEHDHGTINFTYYQTNQVLGEFGVKRLITPNGTQTGGGPGFSYAIDRYTRFYTTVSLQNQRPALSILVQFK